MNILLGILYHDLLPVFVVAGAGFLFGRLTNPDIRATNRLALYVLSPCLVFNLIARSQIGGEEFGRIMAFSVTVILLTGGVGWLAARALHLDSAQLRGFLLAIMFVNAGNFGLAVTQFAFGEAALARAAVYFVTSSMLVYTLGLYLAAGHGVSPFQALQKVLGVPPVYAVLAAGLVRITGVTLPEPVLRAIGLIGQAAIPVFLLILGIQLARVRVVQRWRIVLAGTLLRLLGGALTGLGLAGVFGLSGPALQASVLEASMPAAVINTIIAAEHDVEPGLVSSIVMLSTLLSPFTLTLLIAVLK